MSSDGFLLDSHILIWSLYQKEKLSTAQRSVLEGKGETWISVATIWEIEIKKLNGRLPLPDAIWEHSRLVGHRFLTITAQHAITAARLPRHHGDPFDRMLIAQAMTEKLSVLTADRHFPLYDITVV